MFVLKTNQNPCFEPKFSNSILVAACKSNIFPTMPWTTHGHVMPILDSEADLELFMPTGYVGSLTPK